MLRSHTCGELRSSHIGQTVALTGWVQRSRDKGGLLWIDLRDRYGLTQLLFEDGKVSADTLQIARSLGREFVIQAKGEVIERLSKNPKMPTGDIEIRVTELTLLNASKVPPFMIENDTDGGDELRMKYRYLDIRRSAVRENLELRHRVAQATREYLSGNSFLEIETPVLIKSTPEGARDFLVPSRMNPGQFYALPQSPQTFKQILMVAGMDRYFQIVKCFRDEDLRADRQPEFTQIDCEMSFITQEDILDMFEGLVRFLFKKVKGIEFEKFPRMYYDDAMRLYGSDKPHIGFGMQFNDITAMTKGKNFPVFEIAGAVLAICAENCSEYTRKDIDSLTEWVKRPQIGAKGLVYVKYGSDGTLKSSVDKYYTAEDLKSWADACQAKPGDLILILSGELHKTRKQMGELRLEMGNRLGLRDRSKYFPLWVINFPLLEQDEETGKWNAMHHPFTSPLPEDMDKLNTDLGAVRANAYDMVLNGVEVGGGSIRIHDRAVQQRMFSILGFTPEQAYSQFGFLLDAFEYGAPPHGGLAFGLDRLCALMGGQESIRDFIAFPKNTSGRDVMIDSPSIVDSAQLDELSVAVKLKK